MQWIPFTLGVVVGGALVKWVSGKKEEKEKGEKKSEKQVPRTVAFKMTGMACERSEGVSICCRL